MSILIHVSTIIQNSNGQILFVKEAKEVHRGLWNLPGGHVEPGEHLEQAAVREVKEETCLDVTLTGLLNICDGITPRIQSLRFTFLGACAELGKAEAGDEILELGWFTANEVLAMDDSELVGPRLLRPILADYEKGLRYPLEAIRITG